MVDFGLVHLTDDPTATCGSLAASAWWVSEACKDGQLAQVAIRHALTTEQVYFRADGSTYHTATLDPESGQVLDRGTFQGARPESCWSRGQAWAIAGFAEAYRYTGRSGFLEASLRAWQYYSKQSNGTLPLWGFEAPHGSPRDSSAAAIAAYGILLLGMTCGDTSLINAGLAHLAYLYEHCLRDVGYDGLLDHAAYSVPHGVGIDEAIVWGDYFFMKALDLLDRL